MGVRLYCLFLNFVQLTEEITYDLMYITISSTQLLFALVTERAL